MGVCRGHGTAELDGRLMATLCGVVERVNKLVYVRPLRARYLVITIILSGNKKLGFCYFSQ